MWLDHEIGPAWGVERVPVEYGSRRLTGTESDWSGSFRAVLADILEHGDRVAAGRSLSVGSGRETRELLNHTLHVPALHDRLLFAPGLRFNIFAAVGRFVWMMSGNNRVADIEFYDEKAASFSDDGRTIPGSCDGFRLLNPRPGLNQLENVIGLLISEPWTRRAVATVYHPDDAGRVSCDVPCHIGVAYSRRNDQLCATTMMRSCNAARVLPYDFFLFTMLAEYVARSVGAIPGQYSQFTVSLHIYAEDIDLANSVVDDALTGAGQSQMAPMPQGDPAPAVTGLIAVERAIRQSYLLADRTWMLRHEEVITSSLPGYWQDFARVILIHAIRKSMLESAAKSELSSEVDSKLSPAFRYFVH
jgi:thymidylate synthase